MLREPKKRPRKKKTRIGEAIHDLRFRSCRIRTIGELFPQCFAYVDIIRVGEMPWHIRREERGTIDARTSRHESGIQRIALSASIYVPLGGHVPSKYFGTNRADKDNKDSHLNYPSLYYTSYLPLLPHFNTALFFLLYFQS